MTIGEQIRVCRSEKGLTQNELSEKTGVSRNYISDLEANRYVPSVKTLGKIAKVLGMDLNFIPEMSEIQDK